MPEFDAYSATTRAAKPEAFLSMLWKPGFEVREGRGFHGFDKRLSVKCGSSREEVGAVSYGGSHGELVMVEAKGIWTTELIGRLRDEVPDHNCTRVDSCHDADVPGAWDDYLAIVEDVKARHKIKGEKRGDWDYPDDGRTMYLGATSSPVRVRLYEKGKQPEYRHAGRSDWVRLEVQVRPQKDAKRAYSTMSAADVWGASKFTREIASRAFSLDAGVFPAGGVKKENDLERRLHWMVQQYAPTLLELREAVGTWECVGASLEHMVKAHMRTRSKRG